MNARNTSRYESFTLAQVVETAQRLTALDLPAIPVKITPKGAGWEKKPLYRNYHRCKILHPFQIEGMASLELTHLGLVVPPGLVVLDFDASGPGLDALIKRLDREWGILPATTWQETPSGGRHYLYRHPWGEQFRFAGQVCFKDGTDAPVDLVYCRNRFAVIYDLDFPYMGPGGLEALPLIPEGWRNAVIYRRPDIGTPQLPGHGSERDCRRGNAERFENLRRAKIGVRNSTLNLLTFVEVIRGGWDEHAESVCWDAATECGLDDDEICSTVQSALNAALLEWTWSLTWLTHVSDLRISGGMFDTAIILAWKMVVTGKKVIGLSVRELSEILGVSIAKASEYLNGLVEACVLVRHETFHHRYQPFDFEPVLSETESLVNTHPVPDIYRLDEGEGRVFTYGRVRRNLARITLTAHSVFQRLGTGPVLNRDCAGILEALSAEGEATREDLVQKMGISLKRVKRRVDELRGAGIIDVSGSGEVYLVDPDVVRALDDWAARHDVPDRVQMRSQMYNDQRRRRAQEFKKWDAIVCEETAQGSLRATEQEGEDHD